MRARNLHVEYLAALERVDGVGDLVSAFQLRSLAQPFLERRWIVKEGYLTHIEVPYRDFDVEDEVEVTVDEEAGTYSYRSPSDRKRKITGPLADIALYAFNSEVWLDDLSDLIGIEPRRFSQQRTRVLNHLWHLGDVRIAGTHEFAPVFVSRLCGYAPEPEMASVLCNSIWPRGGVVLRVRSSGHESQGAHVLRGIEEFIRADEEGRERFDAPAFDRVLRGFVTESGTSEPVQFLQGNRLKLPHFSQSRELSPERARIIKVMWGIEGKEPPVMAWIEVNQSAKTGYQSFADAFDSAKDLEDVIQKLRRGRYRLRRNP
jgi:hypothetical protein